jgi:hypothetical protein
VIYNHKNVIPSFKFLPGCESANGDDIQKKWVSPNEQHQPLLNDIADFVSHADHAYQH